MIRSRDPNLSWRVSLPAGIRTFNGFFDSRSTPEETDVLKKTEMDETEIAANRREFLAMAAFAAAGFGAMLPASGVAAAPGGAATDFTRWLDSIGGKHKVVLDMREANGGMAMAWA